MKHEKFHYNNISDLRKELEKLQVELPLSENTDGLFQKVQAGSCRFQNRFVIQPMEGCDSTLDGSPGELTLRRYQRFAKSGAAAIWVEAIAILSEGRAKPNQLRITPENLDSYKALVDMIRETSQRELGFVPILIMQATHSGRYSNPQGFSEPIIVYNNPLFEKDKPIDRACIITDDELKELEETFGRAARLAEQAGFDGVDVKSCHRYLLCELLSAYERPGMYGGSFENRTRMLVNSIEAAKASTSRDFLVTSRLNVYDGFPYPYGFGVGTDGTATPDMAEPIKLVKLLQERCGLNLVNITIGNPYVNPHVNRPYDRGNYVPEEHPLEGVARMMNCVGAIKKAAPDMTVIGSGFSYLRALSANLAAGAVEQGICDMVGFGRESIAYPEFIRDLRSQGFMEPRKCCVTCGECAKLLRAGEPDGCVVHDRQIYKPCKE